MPNETVNSGCTDPTQATAWLLFTKELCWGHTILSNGKEHFGPTYRDDQIGQSRTPSKLVPNTVFRSDQTEIIPFDVPTEISGIFG